MKELFQIFRIIKNTKFFVFKESEWKELDRKNEFKNVFECKIDQFILTYSDGQIIDGEYNNEEFLGDQFYFMGDKNKKNEPKILIQKDFDENKYLKSVSAKGRFNHLGFDDKNEIINISEKRIKIIHFAGFRKKLFSKNLKLSTVNNCWYDQQDFCNWYNLKNEWINPGEIVIDEISYGDGIWVWLIEVEGNGQYLIKE